MLLKLHVIVKRKSWIYSRNKRKGIKDIVAVNMKNDIITVSPKNV